MNLPKIEINVEPIYEIQKKFFQYFILMAAIEHKVFSNLTAPIPSDQLAVQIQTDPFLTEKLLDALTTMGFVEKKNGNSPRFCTISCLSISNFLSHHISYENSCGRNNGMEMDYLMVISTSMS